MFVELQLMASESGYSILQFFVMGIYQTVSEMDENAEEDLNKKFRIMLKLHKQITNSEQLRDLNMVLDLAKFLKLQMMINANKLKSMNGLNEFEREEAMLRMKKEQEDVMEQIACKKHKNGKCPSKERLSNENLRLSLPKQRHKNSGQIDENLECMSGQNYSKTPDRAVFE